MIGLPITKGTPVIRIDLTDQVLWAELQEAITSPTDEGFLANVEFVDDERLLDGPDLAADFPKSFPHDYRHAVVFVADRLTMTDPEHSLLVISLSSREDTPPFRCLPRQVQAIENNLAVSNMGFSDFAGAADADGVFRSFPLWEPYRP
jgi:hypothetical protein